MKNILELCQEVAKEIGTIPPKSLFDGKYIRYISIAKDTLDSLLRYGEWSEMIKTATIEINQEKCVYDIIKEIPDFYQICETTLYIKDCKNKIIASFTPEERKKTRILRVENTAFKWSCGVIYFLEKPTEMKIIFQYMPNSIVYDGKTYKEKSVLSEDTDIPIFDEDLVKLGMIWRWKRQRGDSYQDEYEAYHKKLKEIFARS